MSIYDLIKQDEKEMIVYSINEYAGGNKLVFTDDLPHILREWAAQKNTDTEADQINLVNLLGGQLIATKEIKYEMTESDLENEIEHAPSYYLFKSEYQRLIDWYIENKIGDPKDYDNYILGLRLRGLVSLETLAKGEYFGPDLSLILGNDHVLKLCRGARPLKNIRKFCDSYNDVMPCPHLQQFINEVSVARTSNKGTAELCISIHPLDYITMSDNANDWESCMSWRQNGCYRQGTVEMMNSPYVVVAYTKSNHNQMKMSYSYDEEQHYWNSKFWRELFVVTNSIVVGIKGYPDTNRTFAREVLNFIADLAEQNLGIIYDRTNNAASFPQCACNKALPTYFSNGKILSLYCNFECDEDGMYNDFNRTNSDYIMNAKYQPEDDNVTCLSLSYNFSGWSECMVSGRLNFRPNNADELVCQAYNDNLECDVCGERLRGNEVYYLDGQALCENCYMDRAYTGIFTNMEHDVDNGTEVYFVPREENYVNLSDIVSCPKLMLFDDDFDTQKWGSLISTYHTHTINALYSRFGTTYAAPKEVIYLDEIIDPEGFINLLNHNDGVDVDAVYDLCEALGVKN